MVRCHGGGIALDMAKAPFPWPHSALAPVLPAPSEGARTPASAATLPLELAEQPSPAQRTAG